jgi:hypothetical protein
MIFSGTYVLRVACPASPVVCPGKGFFFTDRLIFCYQTTRSFELNLIFNHPWTVSLIFSAIPKKNLYLSLTSYTKPF